METLFLLQMAYHLIDPALHERLGLLLFVLLILHNILDRKWYTKFVRGTYAAKRILNSIINLSLLFSCLGLVLSAAFLSPAILNIFHLKAVLLGRKLHMAFTVWSFILMSIHMGSHWNMIASTIKKRLNDPLRWYPVAIKIIGTLLSAYGAYSFWIRGFPQRMFLRTKYVFFDYNESLLACFGSHIAIQCFIVCFVYCVMSVRTVLWSRFKNGV